MLALMRNTLHATPPTPPHAEMPTHGRAAPDALHPAPETSPLRDLVHLLGGDAQAVTADDAHLPIALRRIDEDAVLTHEGTTAHSLHVVRSGSLKCVRTLEDGYEQVMSFALPGDVVGFDALCDGHQPSSAVALEYTTVYALPLQNLRDLRLRCAPLDGALQRALSRQLLHRAEQTEMLAAVSSDVRLARFLLFMVKRMTEIGQSPRRLHLRMCRRDIASLLGVAHETVSRSFTTMADAGWLAVDNREVSILDLAQLKLRARSTRSPAEAAPGAEHHRHAAGLPHGATDPHAAGGRQPPRPAAWCPSTAHEARTA
jgi:CRP/FNR family transcriptional regulator